MFYFLIGGTQSEDWLATAPSGALSVTAKLALTQLLTDSNWQAGICKYYFRMPTSAYLRRCFSDWRLSWGSICNNMFTSKCTKCCISCSELHKDGTCSFKQILEAAPYKTATVRPLTSHQATIQLRTNVFWYIPTHGHSSIGWPAKTYKSSLRTLDTV